MKKKKGFVLHRVCEQNIIVAEGKENIDFNNLITMNSTAAFLWEKLGDEDFTVDDMARALTSEYDIDKENALNDCEELSQQWLKAGIVS